MRRIYLLTIILLAAPVLGGCGSTVVVNGERYDALTPQEEQLLCNYAVALALEADRSDGMDQLRRRRDRKLTADERDRIGTQRPTEKIDYYGDRSGRATYEWIVDDKTAVQVVIEGRFLGGPDEMTVLVRRIDLEQLDPASKQKLPHSGATLKPASFEVELPPSAPGVKTR